MGPWVERYLDYDFSPDLRPECTTDSMAEDTQSLLDAAFDENGLRIDVPVFQPCAEEGIVDGTTNHHTIALSDPGATWTADHLVKFAAWCGV